METEYTFNNKLQCLEDSEKLRKKGIHSPKLDWSKALKIGNATFFPKDEKRRKKILERYGIKEQEQ